MLMHYKGGHLIQDFEKESIDARILKLTIQK